MDWQSLRMNSKQTPISIKYFCSIRNNESKGRFIQILNFGEPMKKNDLISRDEILEQLADVAAEVEGDLGLYDEQVGRLRQGMVHLRKAHILILRKKYRDAATECDASAKCIPGCIEALQTAGNLRTEIQEPEKAIPYYSDILMYKPDMEQIHYQLGRCYSELRKYKKSIEAYEKEMTISGESSLVHFQIGANYYLLAEELSGAEAGQLEGARPETKQKCGNYLNQAKERIIRGRDVLSDEDFHYWMEQIDNLFKALG